VDIAAKEQLMVAAQKALAGAETEQQKEMTLLTMEEAAYADMVKQEVKLDLLENLLMPDWSHVHM
jgi:SRSO17 transposase